jgi:hypothetical protein
MDAPRPDQIHVGTRVKIDYPGYYWGHGTVEGFVPGGFAVYFEDGDDAGKTQVFGWADLYFTELL